MLSAYLNQTAELKRKIGTDDRGYFTYSEPVYVDCRKQTKTLNSFTENKQIAAPQHIIYLFDEVSEGDIIDGDVVAVVSVWRDLNGEAVGYKAVI